MTRTHNNREGEASVTATSPICQETISDVLERVPTFLAGRPLHDYDATGEDVSATDTIATQNLSLELFIKQYIL